ncbi:transcription factor-like 5 protein [Bufo gargarizans]|uniref:transcription factor-like 5 protein n=1 Tax=Bufo gargarizans TaxID=30331 RepID=UPI001CF4292C|nr:transcription factor-like 5 protein [Bufo gargarizans]
MFEPTQDHRATPGCPTESSDSVASTGEDVVIERAVDFTAADLSIVELTEIEYTQLQQFLYSQIDSQSNEGDVETRRSTPFLPSSNLSNAPQYQSTSLNTGSCEGENVCPIICQSVVSTDNNIMNANQTIGHVDFQELRLMMLNESSLAPSSGNIAEKHPNNTSGDISGAGPMRVRSASDIIGLNKENENFGCMSEPRTRSTVRVRLEDRFNSLATDIPRCTEMLDTGATTNNLVNIVHQPLQLIGTQQLGKCSPLVKNKAASSSLHLVYSGINLQNTTPAGNSDPLLTQTSSSLNSGASCPLLEAAKNHEISLSRGYSFCYQQGIESAKQNLGPQNKPLPEVVSIKVEDTLHKQSIQKRSCTRIRQADTDMERRILNDIGNTCQVAPWAPTRGNTAEKGSDNKQTGLSQRRERHNRMERDRRRRIRVCCDELNNLIPFCTVETDKATTLQWTTAFLKYIQERHGDTLKKEFEAVFCGRTGRRLKVARSEGPRTGSVQEAAGSTTLQDVK